MSNHYVAAEDIGHGKCRWVTIGWRESPESAFDDASEAVGHDDFALYCLAGGDSGEMAGVKADKPE